MLESSADLLYRPFRPLGSLDWRSELEAGCAPGLQHSLECELKYVLRLVPQADLAIGPFDVQLLAERRLQRWV